MLIRPLFRTKHTFHSVFPFLRHQFHIHFHHNHLIPGHFELFIQQNVHSPGAQLKLRKNEAFFCRGTVQPPFTPSIIHYNIAEGEYFFNYQNPKKMHIKPRCRQYPTSGFHATLNVMVLNKSEQRRLILFALPLNSPSAYQTIIQPLLIHEPSAV